MEVKKNAHLRKEFPRKRDCEGVLFYLRTIKDKLHFAD